MNERINCGTIVIIGAIFTSITILLLILSAIIYTTTAVNPCISKYIRTKQSCMNNCGCIWCSENNSSIAGICTYGSDRNNNCYGMGIVSAHECIPNTTMFIATVLLSFVMVVILLLLVFIRCIFNKPLTGYIEIP
jgi:TRAP-type C4-dicarboxylate transport system permease small subunit